MFTASNSASKGIVMTQLRKIILKALNLFGFISCMIGILLNKFSEKNYSVGKGLFIKFCLSALTYGSKNFRKIYSLIFKRGRISLKRKLSNGSDKGIVSFLHGISAAEIAT